ncbi:MAG: hypothetical protein PUE01_08900 [Clostridiaceae bacterium]|nr:hypothetical protein [Clostridiaceae bacterium]
MDFIQNKDAIVWKEFFSLEKGIEFANEIANSYVDLCKVINDIHIDMKESTEFTELLYAFIELEQNNKLLRKYENKYKTEEDYRRLYDESCLELHRKYGNGLNYDDWVKNEIGKEECGFLTYYMDYNQWKDSEISNYQAIEYNKEIAAKRFEQCWKALI